MPPPDSESPKVGRIRITSSSTGELFFIQWITINNSWFEARFQRHQWHHLDLHRGVRVIFVRTRKQNVLSSIFRNIARSTEHRLQMSALNYLVMVNLKLEILSQVLYCVLVTQFLILACHAPSKIRRGFLRFLWLHHRVRRPLLLLRLLRNRPLHVLLTLF